jgi:hypothetical protein
MRSCKVQRKPIVRVVGGVAPTRQLALFFITQVIVIMRKIIYKGVGFTFSMTSHVTWIWEWGCAYMYICIILNTTRLKPWWSWTHHNFAIKHVYTKVVPGWVASWKVWFGGAKSGQCCVFRGGSLQMVLEPLPSLRWRKRA